MQKFVKLTGHTLVFNSLTSFEHAAQAIISRNRNDANLLKLLCKNLWNHIRWTYFWRVLSHLEPTRGRAAASTWERPGGFRVTWLRGGEMYSPRLPIKKRPQAMQAGSSARPKTSSPTLKSQSGGHLTTSPEKSNPGVWPETRRAHHSIQDSGNLSPQMYLASTGLTPQAFTRTTRLPVDANRAVPRRPGPRTS